MLIFIRLFSIPASSALEVHRVPGPVPAVLGWRTIHIETIQICLSAECEGVVCLFIFFFFKWLLFWHIFKTFIALQQGQSRCLSGEARRGSVWALTPLCLGRRCCLATQTYMILTFLKMWSLQGEKKNGSQSFFKWAARRFCFSLSLSSGTDYTPDRWLLGCLLLMFCRMQTGFQGWAEYLQWFDLHLNKPSSESLLYFVLDKK